MSSQVLPHPSDPGYPVEWEGVVVLRDGSIGHVRPVTPAQLVAAAQSAQSDNGYWLEAVLADAQEHPVRLENARTLPTGYAGITKAEIDALAARLLAESNCLRFSFLPAAAVAKAP